MGLASFVGGLIIGRDAAGQMTHYWMAALVGAGASLLAVRMARHLRMHGTGGPVRQPG